MKKSDIAMIILVASVSAMIAYAIASSLSFLRVDPQGVPVEVVEPISTEVAEPDRKVFSKDAINPTVQTVIGGNSDDNE